MVYVTWVSAHINIHNTVHKNNVHIHSFVRPRNTDHKTASVVGWGGRRAVGVGGGVVEKGEKREREKIISTNNMYVFCDPSSHQPLHYSKARGRLSRCSTATPPTNKQTTNPYKTFQTVQKCTLTMWCRGDPWEFGSVPAPLEML